MWNLEKWYRWTYLQSRVPGTARRSNLSMLKEMNPEYSLEGLMPKLKLKLQYFGHLMQRANSLGKTLMLGKTEEEEGAREDEMTRWHHRLNGHEFEQTRGDSEGQGSLVCYSPWGHKKSERTESLKNSNGCEMVSHSDFHWYWLNFPPLTLTFSSTSPHQ